MGDIVNLRRLRKRRAREDAAATAHQARIDSGLTAAARTMAQKLRARDSARLDGHRLDGPQVAPASLDEPRQ